MSKKEKKKNGGHWSYLSIVAIVAVVGVVLLVLNQQNSSACWFADSTDDSTADGNIAGEAGRSKMAKSRTVSASDKGGTFGSVGKDIPFGETKGECITRCQSRDKCSSKSGDDQEICKQGCDSECTEL